MIGFLQSKICVQESDSVLLSTDGNAIDDSQFYSSVIAGGLETQPDSWREQNWPLSSANQIHRLTELRYVDGIRRLKSNSVDEHGNYLDPQPIDLPSARPNPPEEEFGIGMYNYGKVCILISNQRG